MLKKGQNWIWVWVVMFLIKVDNFQVWTFVVIQITTNLALSWNMTKAGLDVNLYIYILDFYFKANK